MAAKSPNRPHGKQKNRNLMREISLVVSARNAEEMSDPDYWDEFDSEEETRRTRYDLSD